MATFFDFRVTGIQGEPDLLGPLRGRVVLAVNVASRCGYTPQYTGLERLHGELAGEGFAVVGFPCNQFGAQEPGTDAGDPRVLLHALRRDLPARLEARGERRGPPPALCLADRPGERASRATSSGTSRSS